MPLNFHFSSRQPSVHQREMEVGVGRGRQTDGQAQTPERGTKRLSKRWVGLRRPQKNSPLFLLPSAWKGTRLKLCLSVSLAGAGS